MKKAIIFGFTCFTWMALSACASRSVTPDVSELKVSREEPPKGCQDLGRVSGLSLSRTPKPEEALEDMKKSAAAKGATYLKVEQYTETGGGVSGTAYSCP